MLMCRASFVDCQHQRKIVRKNRELSWRIIAPEDAHNLVRRFGRYRERVPSDSFRVGCRPFLHCPLFLHPELVTREKTIDQTRLAPDSLMYPVPTQPMGFSRAMFFCQDVADHCTLAGSANSPLFVCGDHSTPLLGSKHGSGSLSFRWSYADNFWGSGSWRKLHRRPPRTSHCRCTDSRSRC